MTMNCLRVKIFVGHHQGILTKLRKTMQLCTCISLLLFLEVVFVWTALNVTLTVKMSDHPETCDIKERKWNDSFANKSEWSPYKEIYPSQNKTQTDSSKVKPMRVLFFQGEKLQHGSYELKMDVSISFPYVSMGFHGFPWVSIGFLRFQEFSLNFLTRVIFYVK